MMSKLDEKYRRFIDDCIICTELKDQKNKLEDKLINLKKKKKDALFILAENFRTKLIVSTVFSYIQVIKEFVRFIIFDVSTVTPL